MLNASHNLILAVQKQTFFSYIFYFFAVGGCSNSKFIMSGALPKNVMITYKNPSEKMDMVGMSIYGATNTSKFLLKSDSTLNIQLSDTSILKVEGMFDFLIFPGDKLEFLKIGDSLFVNTTKDRSNQISFTQDFSKFYYENFEPKPIESHSISLDSINFHKKLLLKRLNNFIEVSKSKLNELKIKHSIEDAYYKIECSRFIDFLKINWMASFNSINLISNVEETDSLTSSLSIKEIEPLFFKLRIGPEYLTKNIISSLPYNFYRIKNKQQLKSDFHFLMKIEAPRLKDYFFALMLNDLIRVGYNKNKSLIKKIRKRVDGSEFRDMGNEYHQFYAHLNRPSKLPNMMFDAYGNKYDFENLVKHGGYSLIHFWAIWCKPCLNEMPNLFDFEKTHPEIKILSVSIDKNVVNPQLINNHFENTFNSLYFNWSVKQNFYKSLKIETIPKYILLDKEGQVVNSFDNIQEIKVLILN